MENGDTESGGGLVTAPLPVDVWDKAAAWLLLCSCWRAVPAVLLATEMSACFGDMEDKADGCLSPGQ